MRRHYASLSSNATAIILGIPEEPALMRLVLSAFRSNGYEATGDRPMTYSFFRTFENRIAA